MKIVLDQILENAGVWDLQTVQNMKKNNSCFYPMFQQMIKLLQEPWKGKILKGIGEVISTLIEGVSTTKSAFDSM